MLFDQNSAWTRVKQAKEKFAWFFVDAITLLCDFLSGFLYPNIVRRFSIFLSISLCRIFIYIVSKCCHKLIPIWFINLLSHFIIKRTKADLVTKLSNAYVHIKYFIWDVTWFTHRMMRKFNDLSNFEFGFSSNELIRCLIFNQHTLSTLYEWDDGWFVNFGHGFCSSISKCEMNP